MPTQFLDPAIGARVLSIEEANALIPELNELVGTQLQLGDEIQRLVADLYAEVGPTNTDDGDEMVDVTLYDTDAARVRNLKLSLAQAAKHYQQGWSEVQQLGAVVKDTSAGLVDFYGKIDDRLVWLCWRYGENEIHHYHELADGFAGRKPLAPIKDRMLN